MTRNVIFRIYKQPIRGYDLERVTLPVAKVRRLEISYLVYTQPIRGYDLERVTLPVAKVRRLEISYLVHIHSPLGAMIWSG